jgi:biopolymer transport protein ExbD
MDDENGSGKWWLVALAVVVLGLGVVGVAGILVTAFFTTRQVDAELQQLTEPAPPPAASAKPRAVVHVSPAGEMRVKGEVVDESGLRAHLAEFAARCRAEGREPAVLIRMEEGTDVKRAVEILKLCTGPDLAIQQVQLATGRDEGE